jgi:hypothetical protein
VEKMKNKKYLKDMDEEELKKLFENIEEFKKNIYDICYQNNMDYQEELGNIFFGDKWNRYIDIFDHYTSFFLRIKNAIEFFENLGVENSDYLNTKDATEYKVLYKEAKKHYNNFNKCNYASNNYYKNEELLENTCKQILRILEEELHKLENITKEEAKDTFLFEVLENEMYYDCYILNNDYTKVFCNINYIKEYI